MRDNSFLERMIGADEQGGTIRALITTVLGKKASIDGFRLTQLNACDTVPARAEWSDKWTA
jgi:hypothetical protein